MGIIDYTIGMNWALSSTAHDWIRTNLPRGCTILELGSGDGSAALTEDYTVYSVEHNPDWLNKYEKVNYIYAPIRPHKQIKGFEKCEWYDKDVIAKTKDISYSIIICDGPPGTIGRAGFLKYISLFRDDVPIIFDDYHRHYERKLAQKVAARRGGQLLIIGLDTYKHVAICWPGKDWYVS